MLRLLERHDDIAHTNQTKETEWDTVVAVGFETRGDLGDTLAHICGSRVVDKNFECSRTNGHGRRLGSEESAIRHLDNAHSIKIEEAYY